jgi:aromatic ring-opening dioxygenase catalytic subunit (LigB family)
MSQRLPTFYLSHGGGPWPYMTGELRRRHSLLEASLKELPARVGARPKAILVVSGHWEESDFAVMASPAPPMLYDYGGFPEHTYHVRYSAAGSPELAHRTAALIQQSGLTTHLDPTRGFDHGTYSLLAVTHPQADIPVIQVALRSDYDPQAHLQLGRALAPLREEGVLIIGSGSSYHNLREFMRPSGRNEASAQFDSWLQDTLVSTTSAERSARLVSWDHAPAARLAHPQEDHLLPLHVAVGAAEHDAGQVIFRQADFFGTLSMSSYQFG